MEPIPTTPFDPARHVIRVREVKEGREEFVTLASLVQAEQPLEAAVGVSPAQLAEIERRLVGLISNNAPPPSLAAETMGAMTDAAKAIVSLKIGQNELQSRVQRLEKTILSFLEARAE